MNKKIILLLAILILIAMPFVSQNVKADRGSLPLQDVVVEEPSQKVLIAWNGEDELLVLSNELKIQANMNTMETETITILEIMPLPSKPTIDKTSFPAEEIKAVIKTHEPIQPITVGSLERGNNYKINLVFQEQIGAHNISVFKINSFEEFEVVIDNYINKNNLDEKGKIIFSANLENLIQDYTKRNIKYFVFDTIEIEKTKEVEPLVYKFKSSYLYYPLSISSLAEGNTSINIFIISNGLIDTKLPKDFKIMSYDSEGAKPIQFKIKEEEIKKIYPDINKVVSNGWFTALEYEGKNKIKEDLIVKRMSLFYWKDNPLLYISLVILIALFIFLAIKVYKQKLKLK